MKPRKTSPRNLLLILLAAVVLRIIISCTLGDRLAFFSQPELAGYLKSESASTITAEPLATEQTEQREQMEQTEPSTQAVTEPDETLAQLAAPFSAISLTEEDSSYVEIQYSSSKKPDVPALLTKPLNWDLTADAPTVLIIHTHGTEAFTPTPGMEYQEDSGEFRTTNSDVNMIALGEELTRQLQSAGIHVIHDKEYYDYPDYEASYDICREALQKHMNSTPSLKLVIDLHRDAAEYSDGTQWATSATVNGKDSAQIMLVMGTDSYYTHPNWEKNLSVALKLHALMEKAHPGSTRPLDLRKQRFNQDLCTGAIIAEIGAAGNTYEQAHVAISVLSEAIVQMARGTE
jgi:stage II sporulation protein P